MSIAAPPFSVGVGQTGHTESRYEMDRVPLAPQKRGRTTWIENKDDKEWGSKLNLAIASL